MEWLHSYSNLRSHPKTKKLARLLSVPVPQAIGHLHCLWWWVIDYVQDGDLSDVDPDVIADGAEWTGDPVLFIDALVNATKERGGSGFLDRDGDRLVVHDFEEYIGRHMERAAKDAARKRGERGQPADDQGKSTARPTDVQRTSNGRRADGVRTAHVEERREEKRREEEKREEQEHMSTAENAMDASGAVEVIDDEFETFWSTYPRKEAKRQAQSLFSRHTNGRRPRIVAASAAYGEWARAHADSPLMLPTTFLSLKNPRWEEWEHGPPPGRDRDTKTAFGVLKDMWEEES